MSQKIYNAEKRPICHKLSNVEFFVVVNIMRWLITSGLANGSRPTLTTPKIHK